ncbi:MAG: hemerythrin family protein [Chitinispirillaceae bacterium]|nr:hemerythrin family protein [Chitinispirillaceae bacterium]
MAYQEERYTLGFPEMDSQHEYLYDLFDSIEPVFTSGNLSATERLVHEIEHYFIFHCECEEHLMRMYNTPSFAVHQSDHERAQQKLLQFLDDYEASRLNPAAMRIFFTGWLMEHSKLSDSEYVTWVKECRKSFRGLRSAGTDFDHID